MRIGMLVAVEIEAVMTQYGSILEKVEISGFEVYRLKIKNNDVFIIHSGAGQIAAAAATQLLVSKYEIEVMVNFGIVGALAEDLSINTLLLVENVVHYDFDTSEYDDVEVGRYLEYPSIYIPTDRDLMKKALEVEKGLRVVNIASGDKFVGNPDRKRQLKKHFNCEICDMEAAGVVLTCNRNKVPVLMLKAVSDGVDGGAVDFNTFYTTSSMAAMEIANRVIENL